MLFRILSSFLILTAFAWGQEQTLRFKPPFSGLNLASPTNLAENEFTIFSNAAIDGEGQIYKRGSFGTIPYNSAALKIDSSYGTRNSPVQQLYRYYTVGGLKRLLALTVGLNNQDTTEFAHWYWLNDTTGRFAYSYTCTDCLPDTFSQVDYRGTQNRGLIQARQNATHNADYLISDSSTFFLNCSNYSDIKFDTVNVADEFGGIAISVLVANDTLLVIERDSLKAAAGPDTIATPRRYEVHYRSAHTQSSTPVIYDAEAMTYLDTVYFSRSMFDPIAWDGTQTYRANVLDFGVFDSLTATGSPYHGTDTSKIWTTNQWSGMWLFMRRANHRYTFGTPPHRWRTSWTLINRNSKNIIFPDTAYGTASSQSMDDSAYAIVSLPIDEVLFEATARSDRSLGNDFIEIDNNYFTYRNQKLIYVSPLTALISAGRGVGKTYPIQSVSDDTVYFTNLLSHEIDAGKTKIKVIRSRFPITRFIKVFKERILWVSDTLYPNSFWWSQPSRPGYVQPNDFSVVNPNDGERILSCWASEDAVYFGKESKIYALENRSVETSGDDPSLWQIVKVSDNVGCESPKSVVQREDMAWFFDWPQGFFSFNRGQIKKISDAIRPLVDSITPSARDKIVGRFYPTKQGDLILWAVPINGSTKANRLLTYSPSTGGWGTWNLTNTDSVRIASMVVQEGPGDVGELFVGLADSAYVLRYNPDGNQDTLRAQGGNRQNTFVLTAESKRFELPGQELRFWEIQPTVNVGATATVAYDFYKNLSSTSVATVSLSHTAGWNSIRKSLPDAVIGNQLSWRITTSSPQSFRLGGLDLTILPAGRRLPE